MLHELANVSFDAMNYGIHDIVFLSSSSILRVMATCLISGLDSWMLSPPAKAIFLVLFISLLFFNYIEQRYERRWGQTQHCEHVFCSTMQDVYLFCKMQMVIYTVKRLAPHLRCEEFTFLQPVWTIQVPGRTLHELSVPSTPSSISNSLFSTAWRAQRSTCLSTDLQGHSTSASSLHNVASRGGGKPAARSLQVNRSPRSTSQPADGEFQQGPTGDRRTQFLSQNAAAAGSNNSVARSPQVCTSPRSTSQPVDGEFQQSPTGHRRTPLLLENSAAAGSNNSGSRSPQVCTSPRSTSQPVDGEFQQSPTGHRITKLLLENSAAAGSHNSGSRSPQVHTCPRSTSQASHE